MAITKIQSESLNLADTYDFTGNVTGAGESNTPYFQAVSSVDISLTQSSATLIPMNQKPFDSGSLFNTSNGRFVMDSANAGKYFIYCKVSIDADTNFTSTGNYLSLSLRQYNSSNTQLLDHGARNSWSLCHYPTVQVSGFFDLANGDYVAPYVTVTGSGLNAFGINTTSPSKLEFTGFKIT
jgi:hypothetical protein